MSNPTSTANRTGLEQLGIRNPGAVHENQTSAQLYEHALRRDEAHLAQEGPLLAVTGEHTGRAPNDKFVVRDAAGEDIWWGKVNRPFERAKFDGVLTKAKAHVEGKELFIFNGYAGTDPRYRIKVRVINENAWQNLFARNMFVREEDPANLEGFEPDFTILHTPSMAAEPERDGTNSGTYILLDFAQKLVLIGGSQYAGEIKKSIFTVMNYLLPKRGVLSMHCSANYGKTREDTALFFGLSGTGKTTLSADPERTLIGDDEHGWSDDGVFNIEGGCYAKVIRLDPEGEPDIYATTKRFGTILENVVMDPETRGLDLDDDSLTENTRASYPIHFLRNFDAEGQGGHPKNVVFLTCDAFGVLPPISRLSSAQAMYHFLSGYTAKVAGTERGVTEPTATFSACFGAPFLPLHPTVYAKLLGEKIARHDARVWLVNTGWSGGAYGTGARMKLAFTRRMLSAALSGELEGVSMNPDPVFGVAVPEHIEGVPGEILTPKKTWADGDAFDAQAHKLAKMFQDNFGKFADEASDSTKAAGPKTG